MKQIFAIFAIFFCQTILAVSIVTLQDEESAPVTVRFNWTDPITLHISGGKLSKSHQFSLKDGFFLEDKQLTPDSTKEEMESAAAGAYNAVLASTRQTLILKHMYKRKILPKYVYKNRDGIYAANGPMIVSLTSQFLSIKFFDSANELLGIATIFNDSGEITWRPKN